MEIIDLTYTIKEGMTTFSSHWHPIVEITQIGRHGFEGRETRKLVLGTHTGTHMDAPRHFVNDGKTINDITLQQLVGPVDILDFTFLKENEFVSKDMLKGKITKDKIIFKFGWGKYWGTSKFYNDYPFISEEAAKYIIEKDVKLVGLDTASPDDGRIKLEKNILGTSKDSPVHKIFLGNEVILVEYLANLEKVDTFDDWNIIVMPLKIENGDGAPVRACIYK